MEIHKDNKRAGSWVTRLLIGMGVVAAAGVGVWTWGHVQQDSSHVMHKRALHKELRKVGDSLLKPSMLDHFHHGHYTQMHAGRIERINNPLKQTKRVPMPHVAEEHYTFTDNEYPVEIKEYPNVGNGHIATALHGPWIHMNGLYNEAGVWSHRAEIPSPVAFNITGPDPEAVREYTLNAYMGVFSTRLAEDDYILTHRIYAHRSITPLLIVEVEVERQNAGSNLTFNVDLNSLSNSSDLHIVSEDSDIEDVSFYHGRIYTPETPDSGLTEVFMYYDAPPEEIVVPEGQTQMKWYFLTSISYDQDKARQAYEDAQAGLDELLTSHTEAWARIWEHGRITLTGTNTRLARAIWGSVYYILSSVPDVQDPDWKYIGLSPGGLPAGRLGQDYQGHIFWDQELWMYPPVLMFHPEMGRTLVESRTRDQVMDYAAANAELNGWEGLQFPWEGGFTGVEVCPAPEPLEYQHHISGCIAFAALNYLYATHDLTMLENSQLDRLLPGVADFWASRTLFNPETGQYEIWRVMGPDEYYHNVNNSVFTNVIARTSMDAARYALSLIGQDEDRWDDHIDNMYIPFDEEIMYHPEWDGYTIGTLVKQADVILLGYPLLHEMTDEVRWNDLEIYQNVTDPDGPAMSWSMFAIGWLELGEQERADELTERNYNYIYNEFQVWRETVVTFPVGAANFVTGMGGFLQNIMNGYGGMRLRRDRLDFNMVLPPDTTEFTMDGVNYLGSSLDLVRQPDEVTVTLTEQDEDAPTLYLYFYENEESVELQVNDPVSFEPTKFGLFLEVPTDGPTDEPNPGDGATVSYCSFCTMILNLILCMTALTF